MRQAFWKSDWFVGLAVSLFFFVALYVMHSALLQSLEVDAYDLGVRMSDRTPSNEVAVIAIDDNSIADIGRWPWSREIMAEFVDRLKAAGAEAIGLTIFYSEEEKPAGLVYFQDLQTEANKPELTGEIADRIRAILTEATVKLDVDTRLGNAIGNSGNTVIAQFFELGQPVGNPDAPLADYITRFAIPAENITDPSGNGFMPHETLATLPPIPVIGTQAHAIAHLVNPPDVDGGLRDEPLVIKYFDDFFPSMSLMLAAEKLNITVKNIYVTLGEGVELRTDRGDSKKISTDSYLQMRTFYYGDRADGRPAFDIDPFYEVWVKNIPIEKYKDKIVIIGMTAAGLADNRPTPIGDARGAVMPLAHAVSSILNEDFFTRPAWADAVEFVLFALAALYLILLLPKLKATPAALISLGLAVALLGAELGLMKFSAMWLQFVTAAVLVLIGHVLLTTKRFAVVELSKQRLDVESSISNKQLAMQYQQKGELDTAFDYFRRCPADDSLLESLYGLATDFQVKRKPEKSMLVYEYIHAKNPKFRDIQTKIAQARNQMDTQMMFPGGRPGGAMGGSGPGASIIAGDGVAKPMLGRYQIERELGKGAMGIVYLGRDPKINRVVAIKTMALAQEFEADELDEVKSRFFREAETAGRLQQPNIVTIYDAGEEHDLAYIAMEFLEGHDLSRYTKADSLLPVPIVLGIVFKSAMALDYAHKNNVVHRDIKPANVMYDPEKKNVKLTDFGIARITDSSKTKTGMVLGTPSYMSPEQLSGKKVDGRSDLFSLGVMLYQLLSGKLPFKGESMATLMFKIANEPHQDLGELRPELTKQRPCLNAIINKALQKDVEKRYQNGAEMARDIQQCAKQVAGK